jgi:hypothetical protein
METTTFDLSELPPEENDQFEFKSSRTQPDSLAEKLGCAASGFANSGGGMFVAGVDNTGNADGGLAIEHFKGRQPLLEWADQVIHRVEPTPRYSCKLADDPMGRGTIDQGKAVLAVLIEEGNFGPHMAPNRHYYVRAGRHTVSARHFIVEALFAKRHVSKPKLTHLVRVRPDDEEVVQIGLVALTDAPAVDIDLAMDPLPGVYGEGCREFPVHIGVIDKHSSFFFDVSTRENDRRNSSDEFVLKVTYHDIASNRYEYEKKINLFRSVPSLRFFRNDLRDVVRSLDSIKEALAPPFPREPPQ